jgi:hypothetical protein
MEQRKSQRQQHEETPISEQPGSKAQWEEPKLSFVKPKLVKHGDLKEVTAAFFQEFTP